MSKSIKIVAFIILAPFFCCAQDKQLKLKEVITEFKESISEKDSVRFNKLFFEKKTPFIGVMSRKTEASIKKDYPDFQGLAVSNNVKFIKDICKSKNKMHEKFYNINIETDNAIAAISFDYSFYSNSNIMQWGYEKWNLVYVDNEWLITNVIYSIHFPDVEQCPFGIESNKK